MKTKKYATIMRKTLAGCTAGVLLLSMSSCGMLEMRDSVPETEALEESMPVLLHQAELRHELETRQEAPAAAPAVSKKATVAFAGDVAVDASIVQDAANRAADGKKYSFIRMYTGVFRNLCGADCAMGRFSTAASLKNSGGTQETPEEVLASLGDLGFDILDTSGVENDASLLEEYGIADLDDREGGEGCVRIVPCGDFELAFLTAPAVHTAGADLVPSVEQAVREADLVVVSARWEPDMTASDKRERAMIWAEAGADVVVGSGTVLEPVEWLEKEDGTQTLVAYSLGNLLATSEQPYELCGGILTFTVEERNGEAEVTDVLLDPTVVRYTAGCADVQLVHLSEYTAELSRDHAVAGVHMDTLLPYVRETVPAEFLIPDLRG